MTKLNNNIRQVTCCGCGMDLSQPFPGDVGVLCSDCGAKVKGKRRTATEEELQSLVTGNARQGWYDDD